MTQQISATGTSAAGPATVWDVVADATRYPEWSHLDSASYERPGTPAPHGAGAIRRFRSGRYVLREEVTDFVAGRELGYRMLSGAPVRDYVSRIVLAPRADGGTDVRWAAGFRPVIPGTGRLIARSLEASLRKLVDGLVAEADRRAGAPASQAPQAA